MRLAYVDESYDKDRYWIACLLCPEDDIIPLTTALDEVVLKAATSYPDVADTAELHGHAIFHGKEDWKSLSLMPRARIGVYNDAFAAIGASQTQIIIRGVDVRGLNARYIRPRHPHAVVLEHLLERIDEQAEEDDELALVIADEVDGADHYRQNLWFCQRYFTRGYRSRQLRRIVDTIHFAPSSASRLVQAVDLVAYMHYRINTANDRDARAIRANQALWARVAPRLTHMHCWLP